MKYFITGATGHLGRVITNELSQYVDNESIRLGVHTDSKAQSLKDQGYEVVPIDFFKQDTLLSAFRDVDFLIYVASKSLDSFSRVQELENVIKAAESSKVKHILSMGFIADQANNPFDLSAFYGYLPRRLASSSISYNILRNALYADPLIPYLPELIERKNVIYPVGDQAISFVSLQDSAEAFMRVATTPELQVSGRIYTLTQNQNYTMKQLANILSEVSGKPIGYRPVSLEEFENIYNEGNAGHVLSSLYAGGSLGLLNEISLVFKLIMGHSATNMHDFLTDHLNK